MLYVDIVAPDKSVFRGEAEGVRAPGTEGSFEVRTNHAPMIAAFEIGPLVVRTEGGETLTYATSGGFLEVLDNVVTVLAETAEPTSEIDEERARRAEERARKRLDEAGTDLDARKQAERELDRARNRLRVSMGDVSA